MASKTRREDTARREETTSHTSGFPARQGMYNPAFEKDACGLAMVATLRGEPGHDIVQLALEALRNLEHRGARERLGEQTRAADHPGLARPGGERERGIQRIRALGARLGPRRRAVGHGDVAEHAGRVVLAGALGGPRQHLERGRIRAGHHVGLGDAGEALDGGSVEADALFEGAFQLGRRDRHGLEVSEHVGEPQPDKANVAFFQRAQHEFLLAIHVRSVGSSC